VAAARACRLEAIGIADHLPLLPVPDPTVTMGVEDLPGYVEAVHALKAEYPGFVLLGIEADYRPETLASVASLLHAHPFDYVIGSVHYLEEWGFDDSRKTHQWHGRDVDQVYRDFFRVVGEAAETGLFDIIGHLDLVKKFGYRPANSLSADLEVLAGRLARSGCLVELNTAGLRKPVGEIYPSESLLRILRAHDVPITFGSDAHAPADVGHAFDQAVALALRAGYERYAFLRPDPSGPGMLREDRPLR